MTFPLFSGSCGRIIHLRDAMDASKTPDQTLDPVSKPTLNVFDGAEQAQGDEGLRRRGVTLMDVRDIRRNAANLYNDFRRHRIGQKWSPDEVRAATNLLTLLHKLVVDLAMEQRLAELEAKVNGMSKSA